MILTNIETVPNREITEHFGMVSGSTVRAKNAVSDWFAGLKNIIGGELGNYTKLLEDSREEAIERMTAQAEEIGADAIVNVRFSTSAIAAGAAEIYVYGTAVKLS